MAFGSRNGESGRSVWLTGNRRDCTPRNGQLKTPEKVAKLLSEHGIKCDVQFVEMDRYHEDYDYCKVLINKFAENVNRNGKDSYWAGLNRESLVLNCGIKISQVVV